MCTQYGPTQKGFTTNLAKQKPNFRKHFAKVQLLPLLFIFFHWLDNFSISSLWTVEEKTMATFSNIGAICKVTSAPSLSSTSSRALFPTTLRSYSHSQVSRSRSVFLDLAQLLMLFYLWFEVYEFWILFHRWIYSGLKSWDYNSKLDIKY